MLKTGEDVTSVEYKDIINGNAQRGGMLTRCPPRTRDLRRLAIYNRQIGEVKPPREEGTRRMQARREKPRAYRYIRRKQLWCKPK